MGSISGMQIIGAALLVRVQVIDRSAFRSDSVEARAVHRIELSVDSVGRQGGEIRECLRRACSSGTAQAA
jgi:hypothetical protein